MFMYMGNVQNQSNDFAESYFTRKELDVLNEDLHNGTFDEQHSTYAQH